MPVAAIRVSAATSNALYRFDKNEDGLLTTAEVRRTYADPAVASRFNQELNTLSARDRATLLRVRSGLLPSARVTFDGQQVGRQRGDITWVAVEERLSQAMASQQATLATMGQPRAGAAINMDCGQIGALYMHYRRTGTQPGTHAAVDSTVAAQSRGPTSGTTPTQLADVMNHHHAADGYLFRRHLVAGRTQVQAGLQRALAADPGGALIQIRDRFQQGEEGAVHWLVVTGLDAAGNVSYYDPKVLDGGQHEYTMTLAELTDAIAYRTSDAAFSLVYGTHSS